MSLIALSWSTSSRASDSGRPLRPARRTSVSIADINGGDWAGRSARRWWPGAQAPRPARGNARWARAAPNHRGGEQSEHQEGENGDDIIVAGVARIGGTRPWRRAARAGAVRPAWTRSSAARKAMIWPRSAPAADGRRPPRPGGPRPSQRDQPVDGARYRRAIAARPRPDCPAAPHCRLCARRSAPQQLDASGAALEIGLEKSRLAADQIAALAAQRLVDGGFEAAGGQQHVERMDLQRVSLPAAPPSPERR